MSRSVEPDPDREDEERPPAGRLSTTGPGPIAGFALPGLVLGWLLRRVSIAVNGYAPTVGWIPVLTLLLVAVVLAAIARSTYRSLHRKDRPIAAHQAVNRLVLAKACALAGAAVAGGYLGYALSWVGIAEAELARQRMYRSLAGGVAGALVVAAALLLERTCRVRRDDG